MLNLHPKPEGVLWLALVLLLPGLQPRPTRRLRTCRPFRARSRRQIAGADARQHQPADKIAAGCGQPGHERRRPAAAAVDPRRTHAIGWSARRPAVRASYLAIDVCAPLARPIV